MRLVAQQKKLGNYQTHTNKKTIAKYIHINPYTAGEENEHSPANATKP